MFKHSLRTGTATGRREEFTGRQGNLGDSGHYRLRRAACRRRHQPTPAKVVAMLVVCCVTNAIAAQHAATLIEDPRPLQTETPVLTAKRVVVAAPRSTHGRKVAEEVHRALDALGAKVELLTDPAGDLATKADGPVVVVGNLADSRCVRELYFRFLCATDLHYPGPGGYELRTLCDPFGSGNNVLLIGYSDPEGAGAAREEFLSRLTDPIPHLAVLRVTRLPLSGRDVERFRNEALGQTAWEVANTTLGDSKGYLYYLTGDPKLGEEYRRSWKAIVESGYAKTEKIVQPHLYSLSRVLPWRLVESMNLFSDEERLAITRFLHGWAESDEGWHHVSRNPRVRSTHLPRQNHELIPALALAYTADYFATHFPQVGGPQEWRTAAAQAFEPYGESWKPLCDGLCRRGRTAGPQRQDRRDRRAG